MKCPCNEKCHFEERSAKKKNMAINISDDPQGVTVA